MLHIRTMTPADLPAGLRLSAQAGWNQTPADWRRLLDLQPNGAFLAEWNGAPVGTTLAVEFGPVAWVAMVLVDEAHRSRGVGSALVRHALGHLHGRGVPTVRLDATPLGRPVYERLGFASQFELARYVGVPAAGPPVDGVEPVGPDRWGDAIELDRAVTATDRSRLLRRLFAEHPGEVRCVRQGGEVVGYRAARPGARAWMLGPCVAGPGAGALLLADACLAHAGERVLVDVPVANAAAVAAVERRGLTVQRAFTRMVRGAEVRERVGELWAAAGPEKG